MCVVISRFRAGLIAATQRRMNRFPRRVDFFHAILKKFRVFLSECWYQLDIVCEIK